MEIFQRVKYKYVNDKIRVFDTYHKYNGSVISIKNTDGAVLARIEPNGRITVFEGYSWDGCTPKFKVFGRFMIGAWDGYRDKNGEQILKYCSLVHDVLCQIYYSLKVKEKFYTRKKIDFIFLEFMDMADIPVIIKYPYYWGTRVYSKFDFLKNLLGGHRA